MTAPPRHAYPSDLTGAEWAVVEPLLLPAKATGRPRVNLCEVLNAIFYVSDNGMKWRALPRDLPAWQTCLGGTQAHPRPLLRTPRR